jgi:hypothetical protein
MPVSSERGSGSKNTNKTSRATQTWTTAKCHRLLRPFASKLQSLKSMTQTLPSIAKPAAKQIKETRKDPAEQAYNPTRETRRPTRRPPSDRALFFAESGLTSRSKQVRHTYSTLRANSPEVVILSTSQATAATSVHNLPFPPAAINWDDSFPISESTARQTARTKKISKESDPFHPHNFLQALNSCVHYSFYSIYKGIYDAFENILTSTACPRLSRGPPSLKIVAARRIAQCILATEEEIESDDVWYDTASEIGVSGEYLREMVRWHAIELLRDAICSNLMPSHKTGVGLPGALIGLCKLHCADAEAESLLKTMIELYPLSTSSNNPAIVTLMHFWRGDKTGMYKILADSFVSEGSPVSLGNTPVNKVLRLAVADIERCEVSMLLVSKALESGFGIWGKSHINAASRQRGGRKAIPFAGKDEPDGSQQKSQGAQSLSPHLGVRAEGMILHLIEKLVASAQSPRSFVAQDMIRNLALGFLLQDEGARVAAEGSWEESFPIAGKVMVLVQSLGGDPENDGIIVKELARCLEDVLDCAGKSGLKSLGKFIASCYEHLYTASGTSVTGKNEMKHLISRLVTYARTGTFPLDVEPYVPTPAKAPKTPLTPKARVVTFTPGKGNTSTQSDIERYYVTQLALSIILGFSRLKCAERNEKWIHWFDKVEHQIIGLKLRTPVKPIVLIRQKASEAPKAGKKERKGWRWEEGLSEWVAVGATPGNALRGKKAVRRAVFTGVEIPVFQGDRRLWKVAYEKSSDYESNDDAERRSENSPIEEERLSESDESLDDPDTSFSVLFEQESRSSASEFDDDDDSNDDDSGEYYAPTPAHVPASVRRSPRKTQRIKRRLQAFSVMQPVSSPALSAWSKKPMKPFDIHGPFGSSSPCSSPAPAPTNVDASRMVRRYPIGRGRKQRIVELRVENNRDSSPVDNEGGLVTVSPLSVSAGNSRRQTAETESLRERTDDDEGSGEDELSVAGSCSWGRQPRGVSAHSRNRKSSLSATSVKIPSSRKRKAGLGIAERVVRRRRSLLASYMDGYGEDELAL